MKYLLSVTVAVLITAFSVHSASAQSPALTNADVTHLVAMHVSDQTVIAVIREAKATQFDLSPRAVSELVPYGVSTAVIAAMRDASTLVPRETEAATGAKTQSLAGLAAAEAENRGTTAKPGKSYTNADLPSKPNARTAAQASTATAFTETPKALAEISFVDGEFLVFFTSTKCKDPTFDLNGSYAYRGKDAVTKGPSGLPVMLIEAKLFTDAHAKRFDHSTTAPQRLTITCTSSNGSKAQFSFKGPDAGSAANWVVVPEELTLAPAATAVTPARGDSPKTALAGSARGAVDKMVNLGLIKRMDVTTGKFYIDGPLWVGFELDGKENIVKVISGYRAAEYKGLPQVTLYESRSGKELASYGVFTGVTIR